MQKFLSIIFLIFLFGCGSTEEKVVDQSLSNKEQAIKVYKEGLKAVEETDYFYASKKFSQAEILLPQSVWAAKSALMSSYCLYSMNLYDEAIVNLKRFIKVYPADSNVGYAHYLVAIIYYEKILDEDKLLF